MSDRKRILLIVSGGIAAYKSLELARLLTRSDHKVRAILTQGGSQFVTPLSFSALTGDKVYTDLWSLTDEAEMGHIELSRDADLLVVAPASADILARMAAGMSNDLATTALLATDKPVLIAPAMNVRMWEHAATKANMSLLEARGIAVVGPNEGDMACGEYGYGRMAEPTEIAAAIESMLTTDKSLAGYTALVTSGPTHEAIDPVRYIGNRSSGKQGHAIAAALARHGAAVTLVSGPTALPDPTGVKTIRVRTGLEMFEACKASLPVDIAVYAAAVADWRIDAPSRAKLKRSGGSPELKFVENPDILAYVAKSTPRPRLVIGFAAETDNLLEAGAAKRKNKGCNWVLANHVNEAGDVFGSENNAVTLISDRGTTLWQETSKNAIAERLACEVSRVLEKNTVDER